MIIPSDYELQVRQEIKVMLERGNAFVLEKAEKAVSQQVKSYLKKRYNLDRIFIPINEFKIDKYYQTDEYCYYKGIDDADTEYKIYRCTFECQGIDPIEEDFWVLDDFRNSLLVMYSIDLILYHLYSSTASHKMPTHRAERYEDAVEWLKAIAEGKIEVDLPLKLENLRENYNFRSGSQEKRIHRY